MTTLMERIKADSLVARKAKDARLAALLTTLLAEAAKVGKDAGNRETSPDEALAVLRKFLKNVAETMAARPQDENAAWERVVLEAYLPAQLSEEALKAEVLLIVGSLPEVSPKATGIVMARLKAGFNGRYDGSMAARLVKEALAG